MGIDRATVGSGQWLETHFDRVFEVDALIEGALVAAALSARRDYVRLGRRMPIWRDKSRGIGLSRDAGVKGRRCSQFSRRWEPSKPHLSTGEPIVASISVGA